MLSVENSLPQRGESQASGSGDSLCCTPRTIQIWPQIVREELFNLHLPWTLSLGLNQYSISEATTNFAVPPPQPL